MRNEFKKLSVVMPAYNEAQHIYENALRVSEIIATMSPDYEILVVNDGSSDQTLEEARRAAAADARIRVLDSQPNVGKGWALRQGTEEAQGDYIAFCDADLDLSPSHLEDFFDRMQRYDADAVIGSKMHADSKVDYPFIRRVYSWGYYLLLAALFRLNVKDTQTGLKLFKADVVKPVMRRTLVKRFAFDIEILAIIKREGGRIASAPIEMVFRRTFGRINFGDAWKMLWDTLAVFYRLKILRYYDEELPKVQR